MTLGEKIKACRQAAGMSQEKVAELVGVSRQAVTKWEANQSAPYTENLFKLAEIFGTTVDFLLTSREAENSPAEQISYLYKMEEEKKAKARRDKLRSNLLLTLAVIGGYLFIYLTGRIFTTTGSQMSVTGWLFGSEPQQPSYHTVIAAPQYLPGSPWPYPRSRIVWETIFSFHITPLTRFASLVGDVAATIRRAPHTDTATTVGPSGDLSLHSLCSWE